MTPQPTNFQIYSDAITRWVIPMIFLFIITYGYARKVKVYEVFVEGAKDGFTTAITIIPYLVAIFAAIALFQVSGAMDFLARNLIGFLIPPSIMHPDVILMSLMKPLSGGAARGLMLDVFDRHGIDSFPAYMASVIQGSTETTFYVIAVYFGAVNVKKARHTVTVGLLAELIAIIVSVIIAHILFRSLS